MSYKAECRNTSVYQSVCNFTQPGLTDLYGTCLTHQSSEENPATFNRVDHLWPHKRGDWAYL